MNEPRRGSAAKETRKGGWGLIKARKDGVQMTERDLRVPFSARFNKWIGVSG